MSESNTMPGAPERYTLAELHPQLCEGMRLKFSSRASGITLYAVFDGFALCDPAGDTLPFDLAAALEPGWEILGPEDASLEAAAQTMMDSISRAWSRTFLPWKAIPESDKKEFREAMREALKAREKVLSEMGEGPWAAGGPCLGSNRLPEPRITEGGA